MSSFTTTIFTIKATIIIRYWKYVPCEDRVNNLRFKEKEYRDANSDLILPDNLIKINYEVTVAMTKSFVFRGSGAIYHLTICDYL